MPISSPATVRAVAAVRLRVRRTARGPLGIPRAASYSLSWDMLAGVFSGAYMGIAFPFFTKIARGELHASATAIALMSAAPFVGNLLSPVWARQMEGRAKMPFVIGSWLVARSLLFWMPLLGGTAWGFVALVGGLQFVGTISTPAYTTLMRDIYPDRARGKLMGYVRVVAQTSMFFATMLAGRLLDHGLSFKALLPVAGLMGWGAAYGFSQVRSLPPTGSPLPSPRAYRRRHRIVGPLLTLEPSSDGIAASRGGNARFVRETVGILGYNIPYRWFAASVMVYGAANLAVQPLFALYQVDVLHISGTQIANLVNFASLWSILGSFWWGRFADRHGPPLAVLWSIVCVALIPLVYLTAQSVPWLLFASALSGFGMAGIEISYLASILRYSEEGRAAQYQSLHSFLLGVRGVLAPLLSIPLSRQVGFKPVFAGTCLIMLIGALLQVMAIRTAHHAPNKGVA